MVGFPFVAVLQVIKERLLWLYRTLHPVPALCRPLQKELMV
ncbi:MAG: hypothetical protein WBK20_05825 [Spirochaetota bacterium]